MTLSKKASRRQAKENSYALRILGIMGRSGRDVSQTCQPCQPQAPGRRTGGGAQPGARPRARARAGQAHGHAPGRRRGEHGRAQGQAMIPVQRRRKLRTYHEHQRRLRHKACAHALLWRAELPVLCYHAQLRTRALQDQNKALGPRLRGCKEKQKQHKQLEHRTSSNRQQQQQHKRTQTSSDN